MGQMTHFHRQSFRVYAPELTDRFVGETSMPDVPWGAPGMQSKLGGATAGFGFE